MTQNGILDKVRNVLISTKIRVWDKNLKLKFSKRKSEHRVPVRGEHGAGNWSYYSPSTGVECVLIEFDVSNCYYP